jgi:hypothetical protein
VRDVIAGSWDRSRAAGVDPELSVAPIVFEVEEAQERWRTHALAGALPAIRELLLDLHGDARQLALFCDRDGTLLWVDGEPHVTDEARSVHLQPGSLWSEAATGTNGMGTALAVGHPLQVFSHEHFSSAISGWACSAAPVRDPETGEAVGVLDLSGQLATVHPHSLAIVAAAARAAEAELRRVSDEVAARMVDEYGRRIGRGPGQARALAGPTGLVLMATPDGLAGRRLAIPPGGGRVALPNGGAVVAEPVPTGHGYLLWAVNGHGDAAPTPLRLEALGRDRARLIGLAEPVPLTRRHGELLALLLLRPEGWTAEQLSIELLGDFGKPVTIRAEISRLRRLIGSRLTAQPYRLAGPVTADFLEVESLTREGRLEEALDRYAGDFLPTSDVPALTEVRRRLEMLLRSAVLASGDAAVLERWLDSSSGRDDEQACRALLALTTPGDRRRALAVSRLTRILGM